MTVQSFIIDKDVNGRVGGIHKSINGELNIAQDFGKIEIQIQCIFDTDRQVIVFYKEMPKVNEKAKTK